MSGYKVNGIDFLDRYITFAEIGIGTGLWSWGYNTFGELGLNDTISRSSPVQVGTDTNWKQIHRGQASLIATTGANNTFAIKTNGTLWAWGHNGDGQLGLNDTIRYSSPVQVGTDTNWKYINSTNQIDASVTKTFQAGHTSAIKTDGTLFAWGRNGYGQHGVNDRITRSSPVQVGTDTNWKLISCGEEFSIALKTDGTLWAWARNDTGQFGINNTTDYSSPVQVGTNNDYVLISAGVKYVCALKTNGTLWSWGANNNGQLGLNNTINYSSPVQVGTDTDWEYVVTSIAGTFALKTNGTLWSWGRSSNGELGQNDRISRSSPVQIGTDTNWKTVASIAQDVNASTTGHSIFALKTDGTLWSWGFNNQGELGLNNTISRSSPVQVGNNYNWKDFFIRYQSL